MRPLVFAGNWKMNIGPVDAREYLRAFFAAGEMPRERSVWFFPPAVSIAAVVQGAAGHRNVLVGSQDIHWEPKGAFTGAISGPIQCALLSTATAPSHQHAKRARIVSGQFSRCTSTRSPGRMPRLCSPPAMRATSSANFA